MATKLDRLLEAIDPRRVFEVVDRRADEAVNSFRAPAACIEQWEDFERCMGAFFRHVENRVLELGSGLVGDETMDWARCREAPVRIYGANGGEKAAFEMARTGAEGGLYGVLKAVAETMAREYAGNEVRAKIHEYWSGLTADEMLSATEEYLDKWGHLLPSELTEGSAARIKANFPRVLEQHPQLLKRLRQVGR